MQHASAVFILAELFLSLRNSIFNLFLSKFIFRIFALHSVEYRKRALNLLRNAIIFQDLPKFPNTKLLKFIFLNCYNSTFDSLDFSCLLAYE